MNINWSVRFKNKTFWLGLIPALLLLAQQAAAVFGMTLDLTALQEQLLDAGVGAVNADTAKSLQQTYISHMMSQKNLGQQLAALGRSGGASETALLGLANQYGQNRGMLESTRNEQLNRLALQLAENQAAQTSDYNKVKADYAADYTNRKNAYQQAQAQAIADWEAESLARMQGYRQDYNTQLNALARQRAASPGRSSSRRRTSGVSSKKTQAAAAPAAGTNRWAAQQAANNNKKLAALDRRDSR